MQINTLHSCYVRTWPLHIASWILKIGESDKMQMFIDSSYSYTKRFADLIKFRETVLKHRLNPTTGRNQYRSELYLNFAVKHILCFWAQAESCDFFYWKF